MSYSRILYLFSLFFIGGIFLFYLISFNNTSYLCLISVFIIGILFFSIHKKYFFVLGVILIAVSLGGIRVNFLFKELSRNYFLKFSEQREDVLVIGRIVSEPKNTLKGEEFTVKVSNLRTNNGDFEEQGKIIVFSKEDRFRYGDIVEIEGTMEAPPVFTGFNYRNYLLKDGIFSQIEARKVKILGHKKTFYWYVLSLKHILREKIKESFSPPQSFIFSSILLGDKKNLPASLKEELNKTGLRHIVAVSGMHIVILESILIPLFISLGFWRRQSLFLTLVFIFFYVAITGFQISAQRAVLMGSVSVFSQILGRPYSGFRTLVFVAFLMIFLNPFLLFYDVGFQLSFLATAGIILLSEYLKKMFKFLPEESFLNLRSIVSMSLSAQVFTLPVLLYNFGYFSLVSPLTNLLTLPFIPLLMFFGFLFLGSSIIFYPLARVISWFCWIVLTYVIRVTRIFSGFSFAAIQIKIPWFLVFSLYLIIGLLLFCLRRKKKLYFLEGR